MRSPHTRGFTLIEVMITVAIIAILASIALPSYQDSVRKARRAEARAALMQLMQQEERYYSLHTTYIAFSRTAIVGDGSQFHWYSGSSAKDSGHEISGAACADEELSSCIVLSAEPGTANVNASFKDDACGTLSLSSTGVKSASGKATNCW